MGALLVGCRHSGIGRLDRWIGGAIHTSAGRFSSLPAILGDRARGEGPGARQKPAPYAAPDESYKGSGASGAVRVRPMSEYERTAADDAEALRLIDRFPLIANVITSMLAPAEVAVRSSTHILTGRYTNPQHSDVPPQFVITLFIDEPTAPMGRITVARDAEVKTFEPKDSDDVGKLLQDLVAGEVFPLLYAMTIDLKAEVVPIPLDPQFGRLEPGE